VKRPKARDTARSVIEQLTGGAKRAAPEEAAGPGQCAGDGCEEGLRARTLVLQGQLSMSADHGKANIKYSKDRCLLVPPTDTTDPNHFHDKHCNRQKFAYQICVGLVCRSLMPRPFPTNSYAFDEKFGVARNDGDPTGRFQAEVAIRVSYATF
jgi:hypothetical protein